MNSQLSYALSPGAALAELRFERSISSEASVKTDGFSLTSTESHARGRGPAPLRCQPGSPVVVLTVDGSAPANWETLVRLRRSDTRQCDSCHGSRTFRDYVARKPNFDNIDLTGVTGLNARTLTWDTVKRLRDTVTTKLVLKGILAREDAKLVADYGIDGIIVSNHSGRVVDSGRATIEVLPEIIEVVGGRMPVLVDSGFRRGTDIIKALAMGAQAVCIGRPYLWDLGAFGQPGVERVLEILRRETRAAPALVQRA